MRKKLFAILLTVGLIFSFVTTSSTVSAERSGTGACTITITTDNIGSNLAQATGPCKGFIEGFYVYQGGHVFGVMGSIDTQVQNGAKYKFNLPPTASDNYLDYELTVTTIVKEKPKPQPKPEPKPETKPEQVKPKPKPVQEKPKQESKPSTSTPSTSKPVTSQPKDSSLNVVEKPKTNTNANSNGEVKVENKDGKNFATSDGVKTEVKDEIKTEEKLTEEAEKEDLDAEKVDAEKDKDDKIEVTAKEEVVKPQKDTNVMLIVIIIALVILTALGLSYFHPTVRQKVNQLVKKLSRKKVE